MAGLVGLNDVHAAVQAAVDKKEGTWDPSDWSDCSVVDVVSFLLNRAKSHPR
jgi:hypothetical protein